MESESWRARTVRFEVGGPRALRLTEEVERIQRLSAEARGVGRMGWSPAPDYARTDSSSGSRTTLCCSLGSVRAMTATQGSVWLVL